MTIAAASALVKTPPGGRKSSARPRGTTKRRRSIFFELFAVTALYLTSFELLVNHFRRGEVLTMAWLFARFGSRDVTSVANYSLLIARPGHQAILAYVSTSCSSLMGILALGALAVTVLRSRKIHTLLGYLCAAAILFVANIVRMVASCLAGLWFGHGALLLFHDWVSTVWNFIATLLGFLLLLYLALPTLERAEQDRIGRHVANRPTAWALKGLGYPTPKLAGPRVNRATLTGWFIRHFVPRRWKRRMAQRRESGRIDYRVGHLAVDQRVTALRDLATDGLGVHGATFVALATHDDAPVVIEALVDVVVEQDLATFVDARTVSLLLWARAWLLASPARRHEAPEVSPLAQRRLTTRLFSPARRRRVKQWRRATLDATTRRAEVLETLCEEGLGYNVVVLLAAASSESDPVVLDALAEAVAMRQWEPVVSPGVVALKLWARAWTMANDVPVASTDADPNVLQKEQKMKNLEVTSGVAASDEATWIASERLEPRVVAVTGAGGAAGISVIKALLQDGHQVVALDADPLATGLHFAGVRPLVVPYADDPTYATSLIDGLSTHRVDALICTVAEEYAPLAACVDELEERGCLTWLPEPSAVETCLDKAAFARAMRQHHVAHPATATTVHESRSLSGPWIVKPRRGRGSRGVATFDRRRELRRALRKDRGLIAQSRLVGQEFTADVLVDHDGRLVSCVPRWRLAVSAGISVRGETFDSDAVTGLCAETLAAVGLTGVANVQGFVDRAGVATVVEVNPRFSGGLPLTLAAGADVVRAFLAGTLYPERPLAPIYFVPGVRMLRYYEEIIDAPYSLEEREQDKEKSESAPLSPVKSAKGRKGREKTRLARRHGVTS